MARPERSKRKRSRERLAPTSLLGRFATLTALVLLLATSALLLEGNGRLREATESGERARLHAIATTLAPRLDGTVLRAMAQRFPRKDGVPSWEEAPAPLQMLHDMLSTATRDNELGTPIETLVPLHDERIRAAPDLHVPHAMQVLVNGGDVAWWRHKTDYRPAMGRALFDGEAVAEAPYSDESGTWISAYAPIRDDSGDVVAIVAVDTSLDRLFDQVDRHTQQLALFAALLFVVLLCALIVMTARLTASLARLADAARRFGAGDYETPIATQGAGEVVQLARALERARRKLSAQRDAEQRYREELADALAKAETATKVKSQFLANMSHELRTPMNAIIGYSEMLLEEAEDAGAAQLTPDLVKIRGAGQHLLTLINDILDLSKIEAGKMELFLEDFPVEKAIEDVVATVRPLVERNGNRIELDLERTLGEMHADLTRVRQILFNLLSNAGKFTRDGTVTLHARRVHRAGEAWLTFEIRDTGIGIAPEEMARLFSAFSQADPSTTRRYGGTGLGLALSRQFAQMLGGDIQAASAPGSGSTFTVELPVVAPTPPTSDERALAPDDESLGLSPSG